MRNLTYLLIWLLLSINLSAQYINVNILQRVFLINYNNNVGSLFTIEVDEKQYLVSAKHLFPGIKESDEILILHDSTWKKMKVRVLQKIRDDVDVIVFKSDLQLSPTFELPPSMGGIILGQDVYFLGFPFGIITDNEEINNLFPLPLIKKGILSGILGLKAGGGQILLVDGYNNKGFSGGPIVYYDKDQKIFKVAGIVSAYRIQRDEIKLGEKVTPFEAITNSGILIGYSIMHAIDIIENSEIGNQID